VNDSAVPKFINVLEHSRAGHLDEISPEETRRDLEVVRRYLETELAIEHMDRPEGEKRRSLAVTRTVLTAIWESPRMEFDALERAKGCDLQLTNKALLVPWSIEAFDQYRSNGNSAGLIFEHVLPLDAIWAELQRLFTELDVQEWFVEAERFLNYNYTVAVLTKPQADMIDAAGYRKTGFPEHAFERYAEVMRAAAKGRIKPSVPNAPLDVKRFVHPGIL